MDKTKKIVMALIDLTSLNLNDNDQMIMDVCAKASNRLGKVAAVCIDPKFVSLAKRLLKNQHIAVASVVNFPLGNDPIETVLADISQVLIDGADEIDLVIPYQDYLQKGGSERALHLVKASKALCNDKLLKVILETGELKSHALIFKAACDAINAGADFIKTSTGKTAVGATVSAVKAMLDAIQVNLHYHPHVGLKVSGGIKTLAEASQYIHLAKEVYGKEKIQVSSMNLRFGASRLVDDLLSNDS
ncbi:deoxyribose-phosphate aldolase [Piscirickettsia salmonis]